MRETSSLYPRRLLPATIVVSGTFAWWFFITINFEEIFSSLGISQSWISVLAALFYGSGAISAIPGSMIGERIERRKFLFFNFSFGIFATVLLLVVEQNLAVALLSSSLLGISLGLGFPSCMTLIPYCTSKKERARFSGVIVLETFIMIFLGIVVLHMADIGLVGIITVATALRATSYFGFSIRFCERGKQKRSSWMSILSNRNLIFYLLPWLAFNLAGELVVLVWAGLLDNTSVTQAYDLGNTLRMAAVAFLGPVAGVTADRVGRKPLIIFALVILGVGFAFLGLATSYYSALFYLIVSGIAWSLLMVSYFTLLGDIASSKLADKFYALGISTPLIAYTLVRGILPTLGITSAKANFLSPIMSLLLFLSIIPVLYVPDTLSTDIKRERRLKDYTEKVGKLVQEAEKNKKP